MLITQPNRLTSALEALFTTHGWESRIVSSAVAAERLVKNRLPDVVLVDCDHVELVAGFLDSVIGQRRFADIPLLFLTRAHQTPPEAWLTGGRKMAFIDRPFGPEMLVDRIRTFHQETQRADYSLTIKQRVVDSGSLDKAALQGRIHKVTTLLRAV